MLIKIRKHFTRKSAQSSLEYVTLFSVVVASIIVGQSFLKRRASGYLKEQGESISSTGWSFANSTEKYVEKLAEGSDQVTTEKINTDDLNKKHFSLVDRKGGEVSVRREEKTEALTKEKYLFTDYATTNYDDYKLEE